MEKKICNLILIGLFIGYSASGQPYENYKKLIDTTFYSTNLGFDKDLVITVPFEWQQNIDRTFPLIVVFDSQNERSHNYILQTIDYLTSNEQMPSSIVVSIASSQSNRYAETLHNISDDKGRIQENEAFLFEELIPFVEGQYQAAPFRIFIGHSRYGYFTTSLFCSRITQLNGVISISPFFTQKNVNLVDSLSSLAKIPLATRKFYRFGIGDDFPEDYHLLEKGLREMPPSLINAKGCFFPQAGHNVTPGLTIGIALYEIFEEWSSIQNHYIDNATKALTVLDSLKKEIKKSYGYPLAFSIGVLNGKGWYFHNEGHYEKAIEAWEQLMAAYPNYSEGYLFILSAQKKLNHPLNTTVDKLKKSLAETTIYNSAEKEEIMEELKEWLE